MYVDLEVHCKYSHMSSRAREIYIFNEFKNKVLNSAYQLKLLHQIGFNLILKVHHTP